MGVGSALCAAVLHGRKAYGSDIQKNYLDSAEERIRKAADGSLKRRTMGTLVYSPDDVSTKLTQLPEEFAKAREELFGLRAG